MKQEISIALDFLCSYIKKFGSIDDETNEKFHVELEKLLIKRYHEHWYPDKPIKGQGYRSLEFTLENNYCDSNVAQICNQLNLKANLLGIQHELTIWIDPYEVSMRLGNHANPKENRHIIISKLDHEGNEIAHTNYDTIFFQANVTKPKLVTMPPKMSSPIEHMNGSGSLTPQRMSPSQQMIDNTVQTFIPCRALSPQAPAFEMLPNFSSHVPSNSDLFENCMQQRDDSLSSEENSGQPERSDTPHSMNSTTSNESADSGYCGYVESYPYYYKLNRLQQALAYQRHTYNKQTNPKGSHGRRIPHRLSKHEYDYSQVLRSESPPTPTPANIGQLSNYLDQEVPFPMSTNHFQAKKFKYPNLPH